MHHQLELFGHVAQTYLDASGGSLRNEDLYRVVAERAGISEAELHQRVPIGASGERHSPVKRKIRWFQQTLKDLGVLERVKGARGLWQLTESAGNKLHRPKSGVSVVAFATDLGVAILGSCDSKFTQLDESVMLCYSSPPYMLREPRAYGNLGNEREYIDFICRVHEPIVRNLAPGGSICLNVSNDIFLPGSPGRSLYRERLVLALAERFGLFKMDEIIWHVPNKAPGPIQWASKRRSQLNVGYEPIYWFALDPLRVKADNRRVLLPHTEKHSQLISRGGESRHENYSDGAYRIRPGAFGKATPGRIARNVLQQGTGCADSNQYRRDATKLGLPLHGASQPLAIADFLVRFLTEEGDLVVDLFSGTFKTAMAAERNRRRWIGFELMLEYVRGSAERFRSAAGFAMSPEMEAIDGLS